MNARPTNNTTYQTLGEWAAARADMRIACVCGRTINLPAATIVSRFKGDGYVAEKMIRLRCGGCGRRGHASVSAVPVLRR